MAAVDVCARGYGFPANKVIVRNSPTLEASPRECYMNAWGLFSEGNGASYVLGYIVVSGVPIEHAWVCYGDDHVDPTPFTNSFETEYYWCAILNIDQFLEAIGPSRLPINLGQWAGHLRQRGGE